MVINEKTLLVKVLNITKYPVSVQISSIVASLFYLFDQDTNKILTLWCVLLPLYLCCVCGRNRVDKSTFQCLTTVSLCKRPQRKEIWRKLMRRGEERVSPAPSLGHFLFEFLIYTLFMPHSSLFPSPFWGSEVTGLRNSCLQAEVERHLSTRKPAWRLNFMVPEGF